MYNVGSVSFDHQLISFVVYFIIYIFSPLLNDVLLKKISCL